MAPKRQRSRPPPTDDHDLKRPIIIGIVQAVAREAVIILIHWWHGGPW
jgi:hypothetical protein